MSKPTMIPFAIDVTDEIPVSGKPWSGGQNNAKLVLHTIEGADPWDIGWPRTWSRWTSAPHLAMNSDRYPDGDWLYQTLPFDVAAYAIRDNDLEDDRFMYQMEMAGRAQNVEDYPDSFFEAIATVADWFVANMEVPNDWLDFSCAQYGVESPCRFSKEQMNLYSGFVGHCHVGYGIDKHWDPGKLDTARVQSFMNDPQEKLGMPYAQFCNFVDSLFKVYPNEFRGDSSYFYRSHDELDAAGNGGIYDIDDHPDWINFWNAFAEAIKPTN